MAGGLHPPESVTASWKPSLTNPETRGTSVIALASLSLVLCYIVVGLRVWTRLRKVNNFGLDDGLIVLSLLPITGLAVAIILGYTRYGLNKHVWDNTSSTVVSSRKVVFACTLLYLIATSFTKISILLFYRRLGSGATTRTYRFALYTAIGSVLIYLVVFTALMLALCRPLNAFWNQVDSQWAAAHSYQCFNEGSIMLSASSISMAEDFAACFLPMMLFWSLKLSFREKLALQLIFGVGIFVCISGILRVVEFMKIYQRTYDITWSLLDLMIWTIIESNIAIICASAPSLHQILRKVIGKPRTSRQTVSNLPRSDRKDTTTMSRYPLHSGSTEQIHLHHAGAPVAMQQLKSGAFEITFLDGVNSIDDF